MKSKIAVLIPIHNELTSHTSDERALLERTKKDRKRLLLQQGDPAQTLARLQLEREPLYREVADYRFVTDRQSPRMLVRAIVQRLEEEGVI